MTDFCCSCLPRACPGLNVQSKSLHETAVLPGCLTYLSDKEAIPSQRGALGMVLFHLVSCMDKDNRKGCVAMEEPCTRCASTWLVGEALGVRGQDTGGIGMCAFQAVA